MSICKTDNAGLNWRYKDTFIKSNDEINFMLKKAFKLAKYDEEIAIKNVKLYKKHLIVSSCNHSYHFTFIKTFIIFFYFVQILIIVPYLSF